MLKGFFGRITDEPVTYVNAPQRAREHGVEVREVSSTTSDEYVNLVTVSGGGHSLSGHAVAAHRGEHRIVLDRRARASTSRRPTTC